MRLNFHQHSLPSETLALSHEAAATLDQLKADLRAEHQPANTTEELLVNELAEQYRRLRRARALEASLLDSGQVLIPHLTAIQRMMSSAERGFHKALSALRQLQKDRGSRSESASALGFVPANSITRLAESPEPIESTARPLTEPRLGVQSTSALARQGAVVGFVPPPCPQDEDIDPADWARAFETRHRIHAKLNR